MRNELISRSGAVTRTIFPGLVPNWPNRRMANGLGTLEARIWNRVRSFSTSASSSGAQGIRKRPPTLAYDVDEVPPASLTFALASQHVLAMSVGWIYVLVAVNAMGGSSADAQSVLRMSMIATGITTILQAHSGLLGSGYLCPASCSLSYLAPTILAGRMGGFPLLFGMTAFSGVFTAILSRFLRGLRVLFPPDVTGLTVATAGIQLVSIGCPKLLGRTASHPEASLLRSIVGVATLIAMIAPSVWGKGKLKLFPIFIGLGVGHLLALATGILSWPMVRAQWVWPFLGFPHRVSGGIAFRASLLVPFMVIGIAAVLKTVGDLTLCQKMNDAEWKRTDMKSVSGGVMANSLGTILSGALGGFAQNNASSSLSLELATGATSRAIALPAGLIMIALAFLPGPAGTFSLMPDPVMGALLVYSTCFLLLAGLQLMTSRMLDARRIFGVGIALVFGLSVEVAPELYRNVPELVRPLFASSTAIATLIAVALNLLFRIGLAKESTLNLRPGEDNLDEITRFMDEQGAAWGMRREVVTRATDAIYEFVSNAGVLDLQSPTTKIVAHFDELRLDVEIEYEGSPIALTNTLPTVEELASGSGVASLSRYLIRASADQVRVKKANGYSVLCLHFEH